MVVAAWAIGVGLLAIRAAAAGNGIYDLSLFTGTGVLDKAPDEDDAIGAGARAQALESGVVRLYGVVLLLSGWVRVGCARLLCGHEVPPRGPGSGVLLHLRGHLFIRRSRCTGFAQFMQMLYTSFVQIIDLEAHDEYTGFGESRRTEATETPRAAAVVGRRPG